MTELEFKEAYSYKKNGSDYLLKSNLGNRWFACTKKIVDKLVTSYGYDFNIVIYWDAADSVNFYRIPFREIYCVFTEDNLTISQDGSRTRWHLMIVDNILSLSCRNRDYKIDVSMYLNECETLSNSNIESYSEGEKIYIQHWAVERNTKFIKDFKEYQLKLKSELRCEICNFSFSETYGVIGDGYIEAHHIVPLSTSNAKVENKFEDLILVCANCHRMLHRTKHTLPVSALKLALTNN